MQIFVLVNGEQQGPFTVDQLKGYLAMGQFQHTDMAWREGMPDWKPLGEFPEFPAKVHRTPNYRGVPIRKIAPKKSGKGKNIMATISFLVVLAAAGAGGYYFWQQHQKNAANGGVPAAPTDSEFASGKPGIPKTLDELNKWYEEPPADQNAAVYFLKGSDGLQIEDADRNSTSLPLFGKAALPAPGVPVSGAMKRSLQAFLEKNQAAVDQFERGAKLRTSRYPGDMNLGLNTGVPHLSKLRQAAWMGELYAISQADGRNGEGAAKGVSLALAAGRTLQPEPWLVSQSYRVIVQGHAIDALEQIVNRVSLPQDSLAQLQGEFNQAAEDEASGNGFNRAYVAGRVTVSETLERPPETVGEEFARGGGQNFQAVFGDVPEKFLAHPKEQRQFVETSFDQVLAARKEPFPARLKAHDLITSMAADAKGKEYLFAAYVLGAGPTNSGSSIFSNMTAKEASSLARLRLAQTAIALERFRAVSTNRYPASLTELAPKFLPAVPADPFDGQPLRYQKGTQGYLLHSIGPDLKDDGGVRKPGSDDLPFSVARPPRAS